MTIGIRLREKITEFWHYFLEGLPDLNFYTAGFLRKWYFDDRILRDGGYGTHSCGNSYEAGWQAKVIRP